MVHLATVPHDDSIDQPLVQGMEKLSMSYPEDTFTTAVYASHFAAEDLPKHEIPERAMPKEVAYRMIKDDLSLDGNPMLKYVHFFQITEQWGIQDLFHVDLEERYGSNSC